MSPASKGAKFFVVGIIYTSISAPLFRLSNCFFGIKFCLPVNHAVGRAIWEGKLSGFFTPHTRRHINATQVVC